VAKKAVSTNKRSSKRTGADKSTRQEDSSVVTQVAEYVGASLGHLLNQRDRLANQVADLDRRIADLGPGRSTTRKSATGPERKGNRKKHRGKPEETAAPKQALRKVSAAASARAAARTRATARSSR